MDSNEKYRPVTDEELEHHQGGLMGMLSRGALPVVALLFMLGLFLTYLQLSRNQDHLVERTAVQHAQVYSHILDRIRELYASEVVETARVSGLEVTHDYRNHNNAIPLPITLSRELEHKLGTGDTGTTARIYSPFPFEWREKFGGLPDQFAEDAWAAFEKDPDRQDYYVIEPYNGVVSLRYAIPQKMQQKCIECHNSYEGSPKTDWKPEDVRGVMEIVYPLEQAEALARHSIWETFGILSPMLLLALIMLGLTLGQHRRWNRALEARIRSQKKAKTALRMSEARYRTVLETTPDFNMIVDETGTIEFVNRAAKAYENATIGTNLLDYMDEETAEKMRASLDRALVSGKLVSLQFQQPDDEGNTVYFSTRIQRLADTDGRLLVVSTDVSEQRRLETQARQAQRMQAVGRLAGGVAHDFNNLLTAIVSFSTFAMKDVDPDDKVYRDLQQVLDAAARGGELTKQLLAFSRHHKRSTKVANINQTVTAVEGMLSRLLGADVELEVVLGNGLKNVQIDSASLDQVIVNLALNARDAMPEGGHIEISTEALSLSEASAAAVGLGNAGDYVCITVADDGTGMDEMTMRHMFDPFFTTKPSGKGTGLGLSTCWGIVQQAGGQIDVQSEPGVGTTMRVFLPGVDAQATSPDDSNEKIVVPGDETVVVVEDDDSVRELVVRALRTYGYRVLEAVDGVDALDLFEISPPGSIDMLLTDVVMPRMNGPELADRVSKTHPGAKLLYMSGYSDDSLFENCKDAELLQKPFTPEALGIKVREVLDSQDDTRGENESRTRS